MSALAVLTVTAFAAFVNKSAANEIVYDFSVFDEADKTVNENWSYNPNDAGWNSVNNAAQVTSSAINSRLAGILFTTTGSNAIVWQIYGVIDGTDYGKQLVVRSSGVSAQFTEASAGDEIVFFSASNNKDVEFAGQTIAKGAAYAEYTIVAETDAPTIALPKNLTIRTITIKPASADAGRTWDITAVTAADFEGADKESGNLVEAAAFGNEWSNYKNSNGALEDEELMLSATTPFGPTKGLKFTAAKNKLFLRFYTSAQYGGYHLYSDDGNGATMKIPAESGKAVIITAYTQNKPNITVLAGAEESGIVTEKTQGIYEDYLLNATADIVELKLDRGISINKIFVGDKPTPKDPGLAVTKEETEVLMGETETIEWTSNRDKTPTFTSNDETIATVNAEGVISGVAPGVTTITVSYPANAYYKEASVDVKVTVKMPGSNKIEELLANVIESLEVGATEATLTLDGAGEYTLDAEAAAGFVNLTIEGNGAKIVLGENGAISAKQGLTIKNVNIDAANGKVAPIQLAAMAKSITEGEGENATTIETLDATLYNLHGENGKNAYFNEKAITLEKVNVSGLTTALIQTQKCDGGGWCLKNLNIKNSIFQLNATGGIFLDWQTNGGDGIIKNINVEGSTFYNVQENDGVFFIKLTNAGNLPAKLYGPDDPELTWKMTNNTFAQVFISNFADRYTSNAVAQITWTKNIFFSTGNLSKVRNCTFNFTAEDNSTFGTNANNNKDRATVEDTKITVPTDAFDFNEEALIPYFSLFKRTLAYENRMGDTRWLVEGKVAEGRVWDFSANATNYPDEWAAIVADEVNWLVSKPNQRYQNNVALEGTEAVVNVTVPATEEGGEATVETRKISFMEGLVWTADVKKLLIGNGDDNYNCLQIQKGAKFTVSGVYAGDVIAVTACSTTKNVVADNIRFVNAYPELLEVAKAGEYTEYTVTAVNDGEVTFEAAKDVRLQKLEIRPMTADYSYPSLAIRLANDIAKDETIVNPEDGSTTVKEFNTKGVRKHAGDKDAIVPTTKNAMVPVTYTSSDESVITVDAEGNFEAIAPGVATITVEQAEGAGFFGATLKRFIVVNPDLAFHTAAINMESEKAELLYTPDALGYVAGADNNGINDYHILPTYASWMFYNNGNDGDGYVQAKNGNNSWMKVDYRDGANDAVCNEACPNSEVTGLNACYRPSVSGGFDLTMDYWVTGISAVKFYYCTSASTEGGLRLNVYEENTEGEPVATLAGVSNTKGKAQSGFSYTVQIDDLDPAKNYIVRALREGAGDVLVYASKFYTENTATGIAEVAVPGRFVDGVIYDLQGRKVTNMQKGSIYLLNGKKFMSK